MSDLILRSPCEHGNLGMCGVEYQHPHHGWITCPGSTDETVVLDYAAAWHVLADVCQDYDIPLLPVEVSTAIVDAALVAARRSREANSE